MASEALRHMDFSDGSVQSMTYEGQDVHMTFVDWREQARRFRFSGVVYFMCTGLPEADHVRIRDRSPEIELAVEALEPCGEATAAPGEYGLTHLEMSDDASRLIVVFREFEEETLLPAEQ